MINYRNLYLGISRVAWGYVFIYFDINIGSMSILPSFVGYILFMNALNILEEEERELSLLKIPCALLIIWNLAKWLFGLILLNIEGILLFLDIIVCLLTLYFHFQLLTNIASLAERYQGHGCCYDEKLLKYRSVQTVIFTAVMGITYVSSLISDIWAYISLLMAIIYIIVGIFLIKALFDLQKSFAEEDDE